MADLRSLTQQLADELEELSKTTCWTAQYPACDNAGCVDRAALVAEARKELASTSDSQETKS